MFDAGFCRQKRQSKLKGEFLKMKNVIKIFVFAAVLFVPAIVLAQGSGSSEPPSRPPINEGIRDESDFVVTRSTAGTIVGLKEGILTIKTDKDKEVRVALVKQTKFKLGKKTLDSKELNEDLFKQGQAVKIVYVAFADKQSRVDKAAVEVRFVEDKKSKEKPKLG